MYLTVLWICDRGFDADSGNNIHFFVKVNKSDFKEKGKENKKHRGGLVF